MARTEFISTIRALRSDNAKELALCDFLAENGMLHQFSCVERPQQKSVKERQHQHLLMLLEHCSFNLTFLLCFGEIVYCYILEQ